MRSGRSREPLRRLRVFARLTWCMQVLALVIAVNCTGIVHAVRDFADAITGDTHADDDDCSAPNDPSHECPPGCPTCHGECGFVRALPAGEELTGLGSPPYERVQHHVVEPEAPRQTDLSSLYRPPRSPSLSS